MTFLKGLCMPSLIHFGGIVTACNRRSLFICDVCSVSAISCAVVVKQDTFLYQNHSYSGIKGLQPPMLTSLRDITTGLFPLTTTPCIRHCSPDSPASFLPVPAYLIDRPEGSQSPYLVCAVRRAICGAVRWLSTCMAYGRVAKC